MFKNQAMQGVVKTIGQAAAMAPLFGKNAGVRQGNTMLKQGDGVGGIQGKIAGLEGSSKYRFTPASADYKAQVGNVGDKNFQAQVGTPDMYTYNGVDITPLMNQDLKNNQFQNFMSQQSGDWARGFRKDLGIQTGAGRFIGNVVDAFGSVIR